MDDWSHVPVIMIASEIGSAQNFGRPIRGSHEPVRNLDNIPKLRPRPRPGQGPKGRFEEGFRGWE